MTPSGTSTRPPSSHRRTPGPRSTPASVQALHGEWGGARSRFRKAVKTDPGNWSAWWMLGFAEETLGHESAAVDAYSRSLRVDTSLFDPKVNPFAVATRLKARVLLETYERRRVDAALPFSNQLSDPSRVASFFQHQAKAPKGSRRDRGAAADRARRDELFRRHGRTAAGDACSPPRDALTRRRRAYSGSSGSEREGPIEVSPAPSREAPAAAPAEPSPVGPGFGTGSGAPGTGVVPGTGAAPAPAPGTAPRRVL